MKRTVLPLAVAGLMAAVPALAQQQQRMVPDARTMDQSALAPVEDVVMAVEQRLSQLGYSVRPDGRFDADLRNSVMLFQSDTGLQPTGNVDLATIAALGIDVDPSGRTATTAMVQPQPGDQTAMLIEPADEVAVIVPAVEAQTGASVMDGDYPLFKTEHMSAPQIGEELDDGRFENIIGIPQPEIAAAREDLPGIEPYYLEHDWE